MGPPAVVEVDPSSDARPCLRSGFEGVHIDALVFQGAPKTFDEYVVQPSAAPVHGYPDAPVLERVDKRAARELTALVRIEYLRPAVLGEGLFESLHAKPGLHRVRQPPTQDLPAVPI